MKLAVSTLGISDLNWQEIISLAKDIGLEGIELRGHAQIPVNEVLNALRKLRTGRMEIACISCTRLLRAEDIPPAAQEAAETIRMAEQLGAKYVRVFSGCKTDAEGLDEAIAQAMLALLPLAEECGVTLLLESNGVYADTKRLSALLDSLSSHWVGALWDVNHPYRTAGESPEQTVQQLGPYIKHVHFKDSLLRDGQVEFALTGEGDLPLGGCMRALKSINYEGFVTYEWARGSSLNLEDTGVILPLFLRYMESWIKRKAVHMPAKLYDNDTKTGKTLWPKDLLLDMALPEVLESVTREFPEQTALVANGTAWNYSEFKEECEKIARGLIALGVRPGDHVAIWATNVPEYIFAFWGCAMIGASLVTVNTAYKLHEAEYLLRQADVHTLLMIESFRDSNYAETIQSLCPELATLEPGKPLRAKKLPFLRNVVTIGFEMPGCIPWAQMAAQYDTIPVDALRRRIANISKDDIVNLQYTSGTTGFPKGVMLSHANIINTAKIAGDVIDMSSADRIVIVLPLFHCFGLVVSMLGAVIHASTMYPLPFSPGLVAKCIEENKITIFHGVPTMWHALTLHPDSKDADFSALRTGLVGGASSPPEMLAKVKETMGVPEMSTGFGQTECGTVATLATRDCSFDVLSTTIGSPIPGVECRIVDTETGAFLPDNTDGELVLRGYNVMRGYYKMPEATAAAIDDNGWLHTGDMARRRPDGNFQITGRMKDMIIRGGENIYPKEIEDFLFTHPAVADAQVVGVPDPVLGEEAFAWIVPKGDVTEEELRDYALAQMSKHKVPKYFAFTDAIPLNASGKVLKYKLRAMAMEKLSA